MAVQLGQCLPSRSEIPLDAQGLPPLGELYSKIVALIDALTAMDIDAIGRAVYEILHLIYGQNVNIIEFQTAAIAAKIDWNRVVDIITLVLPFILKKL
jgi:hypothetical protein